MARLLALGVLVLALGARAQSPPETAGTTDPKTAQQNAIDALRAGDPRTAAAWFIRHTELEPDNFVPFYNLACAVSLMGDAENAGPLLARAVELGFTNYHQLVRDPHLENARTSPEYRQIVENWPAILEARADANTRELLQRLGENSYRMVRDENLRLIYFTPQDDEFLQTARADLERVARWAAPLFAPDPDPDPVPEAWVSVLLLEPEDFELWSLKNFGIADSFATVAGRYDHDRKQLVAKGLGSTLRHEFFHVLHHRHMDRLGQRHPVWIQEGLAALVESVDLTSDGELRLTHSWRDNAVQRLATFNRLLSLETVSGMSHERFSTKRPLANYAVSRARLFWLAERGRLASFYTDYTRTHADDASGAPAFIRNSGHPAEDVDDAFRTWARALPEVPDPNDRLPVRLGVDIGPGDGRGPVVTRLSSLGRERGFRLGDIVQSVNGQPANDLHEFTRRLAGEGPALLIRVRRGTDHAEISFDK